MTVLIVPPGDDGVRIDRIIRKALAKIPLSAVYRFIRKGLVRVDGKRIRQDYRVKEGDTIEIRVPDADLEPDNDRESHKIRSLMQTEFFRKNFHLIYEDESLLVCNKPEGLVVHGGTGHTGHDTLVDCARSYIMQSGKAGRAGEPVLVHRLDRDTSGVILLAKDKRLLRSLHADLREHLMEKKYIALCHGIPHPPKGTINLSLVKTHERNSGTKVKVREGGMQSLSTYRVTGGNNKVSKVEIMLHTGRTHQIRVHMAHLGCPVIGDVRYGDERRDALLFQDGRAVRRLYLHAEHISFHHPGLNRTVQFTAPLPETFSALLRSE